MTLIESDVSVAYMCYLRLTPRHGDAAFLPMGGNNSEGQATSGGHQCNALVFSYVEIEDDYANCLRMLDKEWPETASSSVQELELTATSLAAQKI